MRWMNGWWQPFTDSDAAARWVIGAIRPPPPSSRPEYWLRMQTSIHSFILFSFILFFLMQSSNLSTTTTTRHDHRCFLSVWSGLCIWIILESICAKCEDQLGLISKPCGSAHISLGLHSSQRLRGVACIIGKYNQMCTPVVTDTFPHMHTPESSPGCPQPENCSDCVRKGARSTVAC